MEAVGRARQQLELGVEALEAGIRELEEQRALDAVPVGLDGLGDLDEGGDVRAPGYLYLFWEH